MRVRRFVFPCPAQQAAQKRSRHRPKLTLFGPVHGRLCRFHVSRRPGFHLHEAENVTFPSYEIHFPFPSRCPPIPGDDNVTERTQVEIRVLFASPSHSNVIGNAGRTD